MSKTTRENEAASLGQLIEDVTLPNCEESFMIIMHICDIINSSAEGPKEAAKSIRKRLATKDPHIIKLALALVETCVKHCGLRFGIQVAHRDFLQDLLKIIKPKSNIPMETQMTVLGLFQTWAFAFQDFPELKEVNKIYQELKNKNVQFPPFEQNDAAQLRVSVKDTSSQVEAFSTSPPVANKGGRGGGASFLIVPQSNNAYSRLSPSGAKRPQPPKSPLAERRPSRTDEGIYSTGPSFLLVPQTSNAHARLSPSGIRKNQLPTPSAERRPLTTDGSEEIIREGSYSTGPSFLIVPHTYDAHARLTPGGVRRQKTCPTPLAERRPSRTDAFGGETSLISYERLSSTDASLKESALSSSAERCSPSAGRAGVKVGEPVSAAGGGCYPDQL